MEVRKKSLDTKQIRRRRTGKASMRCKSTFCMFDGSFVSACRLGDSAKQGKGCG